MDVGNMTFVEFQRKVRHPDGPHVHKITNSFMTQDAYNYIVRNKWMNLPRPVTDHEFFSIIRSVNMCMAENLIEGHDVTFPCRMGTLELVKDAPVTRVKNGKVKTNLAVDWGGTLKLWYRDEEAFRNKTVLRHVVPHIYRTHYDKYRATYENKVFFTFRIMRNLKQRLKEAIMGNHLDALGGQRIGKSRIKIQ